MKGLIWNCRGIKKIGVSSFLRNLILEHKFHFIGIQETLQQDIGDHILRQIDPHQSYLWKWIPSYGRSGGILSGINLEFFDVGFFKEGKFILQMHLWDKQNKKNGASSMCMGLLKRKTEEISCQNWLIFVEKLMIQC